jgi:tetratricopeptide (TPR) repeat protein
MYSIIEPMFLLKKEYNQALADYGKAIWIDKKFAEAYNERALTLSYNKDYDNALESIKKAV